MSTYTKGQEIMLPKGRFGEVVSYAKGWYAIMTDDGSMVKARGKDLRARPQMAADTKTVPREATGGHGRPRETPAATTIATPTPEPQKKAGKTRRGKSNGDSVAAELEAAFYHHALDGVYQYVAKVMDSNVSALKLKYNHLNRGQQRMVLGNLLRSFYRSKGILPARK